MAANSGRKRERTERSTALLGKATAAGAEEALGSLVHQFTDVLAFLRELVQNSLDAASSQIDVTFSFEPEDQGAPGMAVVSVADNGEGMNEYIIDHFLLTLFRSTKEDDLTKIGKFGIGFVSIFAIEPELAVVETGRAGEAWRVLFHRDRHFEKLSLPEPIEGTTVRLYKHMSIKEFEDLRRRGTNVVRFWCKYADTKVRVDGTSVREEFRLDSPLAVHHQEPGTEIWVGLAPVGKGGRPDPTVGFYNRGLTLVEGRSLPEGHAELDGLSIRVRSRYLEHTLTRDNVRKDENFDRVMRLVEQQASEALRPRLLAHMRRLAAHHSLDTDEPDPGPPDLGACFRYLTLRPFQLGRRDGDVSLFPAVEGSPLGLGDLRSAQERSGELLVAEAANPVTRKLASRGRAVVLSHPALADYVAGSLSWSTRNVNSVYHTAVPVEMNSTRHKVSDLVSELLGTAKVRHEQLHLGSLAYPGSPVASLLYIRQEEAFGLTRAGEDNRPTLFGGARQIVVNVDHPLTKSCLSLADGDVPLAALLLAEGVLALEAGASRRAPDLAARTLALEAGEDD